MAITEQQLKELQLYAYVGIDDAVKDGDLGIRQGVCRAGFVPIVMTEAHFLTGRASGFREQFEAQAETTGVKTYLCRFKMVEILWETENGK
jgi:hypothetical protein